MDIGPLLFALFILFGAIVGYFIARPFLNKPGLSMTRRLALMLGGGFLGTCLVALLLFVLAYWLSAP